MKNILCFILGFSLVLAFSLPFAFAEVKITAIIYDTTTDTPVRIGYTMTDTETGYQADFPLGAAGGQVEYHSGIILAKDWKKVAIEPPLIVGTTDYYDFLACRTWVQL